MNLNLSLTLLDVKLVETRVTCEVGHSSDEPFLVWIIPVVDAVVDYVILRKRKILTRFN